MGNGTGTVTLPPASIVAESEYQYSADIVEANVNSINLEKAVDYRNRNVNKAAKNR